MATAYAVYFVVDGDYLPLAAALAHHVCAMNDCDVHIFVEDDRDMARRWHSGDARVVLHDNELRSRLPLGLPASPRLPAIVFQRIFALEVLSHYRRVLYLDVDVFVTEAFDGLWRLPLKHGFAAVHDAGMMFDRVFRVDGYRHTWMAEIGVPGARYFNSGVMLIEPGVIPVGDELIDQIDRYYTRYGAAAGPGNQPFLNYLLRDRWDELSPRWNYQALFFGLGFDEWADPAILHFTEMPRPWHPGYDSVPPQLSPVYRAMLVDAGIDPDQPLGKPFRRKLLVRARKAIRLWLTRAGYRTPREARKRAEALVRRDQCLNFFVDAVHNDRYVDWPRPPFATEPRFVFDGHELVADQSHVVNKVLATARPGTRSVASGRPG